MEPESPESDFSRRAFVTTFVGALGAAGVAAALPGTAAAAEPAAPQASAASPRVSGIDTYLRASGVVGDSRSRNYRDWITVFGWSWGTISRTPEPLAFYTPVGRSTAGLFGKAFTAEPLKKVELRGATQAGEILRLTLTEAVIAQGSSRTSSTSGANGAETDAWSIPSYAKVTFEVRAPDSRGVLGPWSTMTWTVATGIVS